MLGVDRRLSLTLPNINSPVASSLRSSWYSSGFLFRRGMMVDVGGKSAGIDDSGIVDGRWLAR